MYSSRSNSLLTRVWRFLSGSRKSSIVGRSRPTRTGIALRRSNNELPTRERPVRGGDEARELIEMMQWCYEVRHCLSYAARDCFASTDGDDIGWTIAETLENNETPIDPEVYAIALDLAQRRTAGVPVIGGNRLKKAMRWCLGYGDAFLGISIDRDGKSYGISESVYLPTWEMFRHEDGLGRLTHYEQRSQPYGDADYEFLPINVIHFRYEDHFQYGQSIFAQSMEAWGQLKQATFNLSKAANDLGAVPNLHKFPDGYDETSREIWKQEYEGLKMEGIVTDLFLLPGMEIRKMEGANPNLQPLIDTVLQWRYRLIPPGFPVWLFPGLETTGARDIAGQPAAAYARMRNDWCSILAEGIKWAIDIELVLKLGFEEFEKRGQYRLVFPKWTIDQIQNDESNLIGIADLDVENRNTNRRKISRYQLLHPTRNGSTNGR